VEETVKLKASLNAEEHDLVINEIDGKLHVQVDDRHYEIEVHNSEEGSYLMFENRQVYECRVEPTQKSRERFDVSLRGSHHSVTVMDPRRLRTDENSDRHHHGETEIVAQMPGKVVRVLVEAGTHVEEGSGVVIVEAMKMQNEMKSPRTGVVVAVNVAPGDTVNAGEVLATIGEAETG
jgi:biotin carboxyl carrier protein